MVDLRNGCYQEFILIRNTCMISFLLFGRDIAMKNGKQALVSLQMQLLGHVVYKVYILYQSLYSLDCGTRKPVVLIAILISSR